MAHGSHDYFLECARFSRRVSSLTALVSLGVVLAFGALLVLVKWVKALENGTDYSLMNTTKAALFLVTTREEKYKAKAAIDTFFVRGGDTLSALAVLAGTQLLGLRIERYALLNVVAVLGLMVICFKIIGKYRTCKAEAQGGPEASA